MATLARQKPGGEKHIEVQVRSTGTRPGCWCTAERIRFPAQRPANVALPRRYVHLRSIFREHARGSDLEVPLAQPSEFQPSQLQCEEVVSQAAIGLRGSRRAAGCL